MLEIPTAVASEDFAGVGRGEIEALHRLFTEFAPSIAAAADADVHVDTATAHIVENLFVRAWNERASFTSATELHDFLVREAHAMSARELARRASLRRFDEREQVHRAAAAQGEGHVEYDVPAGWERVRQRIEAQNVDPNVAAAERFEASKHGAAEHIAHVGQGVSMKLVAGGVLAVGAVAAVLYWGMDRAGAEFKVTRAINDKDAHAITTTAGQRAAVKLDDGTQVMMAAEDSISVAKGFNRELRAVGVIGAAKFTVASNPKMPFKVHAGGLRITATGTTFTVSAYKDAPAVVTVQEGSVTVTVGKEEREVAAGSGLIMAKDSTVSVPTPEQMAEATQWADGRVVIANRTIREALPVFRRWYLMELRPEVKLLDRTFSMSVPVDKGDSAIVALQQGAQVERIWVNGNMVLVDATAKAAPATKKK